MILPNKIQRPPQENLIGHWLDKYNHTPENGVIPSSVGDTSRLPQPGRAYQFDGVDAYLDTPIVHNFNINSFGLYGVFDPTSGVVRADSRRGVTGNGARMLITDTDISFNKWGNQTETSLSYTYSSSLTKWSSVLMYYNKITLRLECWINGVYDGGVDSIDGTITQSDRSFKLNTVIDSNDNYSTAVGVVGEYKLFLNNTIDESFAQRVFNNEENGNLWYKCEDTGLIAFDSSGNGNHGTKVNTDVTEDNTFSYEGSDVSKSYQNDVGYSDGDGSDNNGLYIPRDESNPTLDVLGNPLQFKGQVSYPAHTVQSFCLLANGVDHAISFTNLTGISILSSKGTSTPSINGNIIELTAGTIYDIQLSDGTKLACAEGGGLNLYPYEGSLEGSLQNGLDYVQQADDFDYNLDNGYSLYQHNTDTVTNPDIRVPLGINPTITDYTKIKDVQPSQRNHNGAETKIDYNPYNAPALSELNIPYAIDDTYRNQLNQFKRNNSDILLYKEDLIDNKLQRAKNYTKE